MRIKFILGVLLFLAVAVSAPAQTHQVALTWVAPTTGPAATGYNVYRYASACPAQILISTATKLTTTPTTALTYTDTSVTSGSYCYFVTSTTATGESAASGTVQVTIPITTAQAAPNPPTVGASTTVQ